MKKSDLILPKVPKSQWRSPSQRKAIYGIEDQTRFRLRARADDGFVVWQIWFDDRDDADEFLKAIALGTLVYQRSLWSMAMPAWHPDLGLDFVLELATVTFYTSSPGTNQTFNVPADWNNSINTIEGIAGAGGATGGNASSNHGAGGGGGAYSKNTNQSLTPGATVNYNIGAAGSSGTGSGTATDGGDTWFNKTSAAAPASTADGILAKAGLKAVTYTGGTGGASASGVGDTKYSGGNAGTFIGGAGGNAGGGSGGPSGNGANGGNQIGGSWGGAGGGAANGGSAGANANADTTTGGVGGAGTGSGGTAGTSGSPTGGNGGISAGGGGAGSSGGAGAGGNGGNGGDGQAWDSAHGPGGGGGGGSGAASGAVGNGGNGGSYGGAGGGGGYIGNTSGGTSKQGILVVTYTGTIIDMPSRMIMVMP